MGLVKVENYKILNVCELVEADWNYKENDDFMQAQLLNNLKRNGQIENIQVRLLDTGFYEVVNGNHRFRALKELGAEKVFVYDHGQISLAEAQRLAIETNETKFKADMVEMASIIKTLSAEYELKDLIETMPYPQTELENLIKMSDFDWQSLEKEKENALSEQEKPEQDTNNKILIQLTPEESDLWKNIKIDLEEKEDKEAFFKLVTFFKQN